MTQIDNFEKKIINVEGLKWSVEKPKDFVDSDIFNFREKIFSKIKKIFKVEEFDESNYFQELREIIEKYELLEKEILKKDISEEKLKNHLLDHWEEFVNEFGHINDHFNIPIKYKYVISETKDVIETIRNQNGIVYEGINSIFLPGSITSFRKILEYKVIEGKDIHIKLGHGVNIQEGVRIVKEGENHYSHAVTHFEQDKDKINKIDIKLGDNSSVAHGVIFKTKDLGENRFEYDLKTGENVFIGIISQIGSSVRLGGNTSVWWGAKIDDDVEMGSGVIVGTGAIIKKGITIPNNCLIPNGAIIDENFKVIDYYQYKNKEHYYDSNSLGENDRRNFVVQLSDNEKQKGEELKSINKDYLFINHFNKNFVTPENKLFASINTLLAIIEKHFPKVELLKELEFKSEIDLKKLLSKIPENTGLDKTFLENDLKNKKTKVILKAFPKDKEKFMTEIGIKVMEAIESGEDITDEIKSYLDFPKIPDNYEKVFLGTNMITGKCKIGEDCFVYDSNIRSDEVGEDDKVVLSNVIVLKSTYHGNGKKKTKDSTIINMVVHGDTTLKNCILGNYHHPSVAHSCNFIEVVNISGGLVSNGVDMDNVELGYGVNLMPGARIKDSEIGDNVIIGNSTIENAYMLANTHIGNGLYTTGGKNGKSLKIFNANKQEGAISLDETNIID